MSDPPDRNVAAGLGPSPPVAPPRDPTPAAPPIPDPPPELARCLAEPGYTPPTRRLDALLSALMHVSDEQVKPLERALARAGSHALAAVLAALPRREPAQRPRLLALLVRLVGEVDDPALFETLLGALEEPVSQSRRLAARGLGKLGEGRAEGRLLEALEVASDVERKSIVDALGALGAAPSARRLASLTSSDEDLVRRVGRARLLIERRLGRSEPGRLILDAPLPAPFPVALFCRAGLAPLLADELRERWKPTIIGPTRVDVVHRGPLRELLAARTALDLALIVPLPRLGASPEQTPEQSIVAALVGPECLAALAAWTAGVPRFRVSWTSGGHHRALTWALARALRERTSALINDSQAASWTLRAAPDARGELQLVPRFDDPRDGLGGDPRFAYRRADVPASSHPTIAAALARLAGVQRDEVVWDPFVGSGLELVERARLGAVRELWGSDIDARALAAARLNLDAAGLSFARLVESSALDFAPASPSLIVSNPPMGRRVARDGSLAELMDRFLGHAARVLRPGGRLVWLSPLAQRTERVARQLGLDVSTGPNIDLGGFSAQVQVCRRPC